jgi:hypothetical protein
VTRKPGRQYPYRPLQVAAGMSLEFSFAFPQLILRSNASASKYNYGVQTLHDPGVEVAVLEYVPFWIIRSILDLHC